MTKAYDEQIKIWASKKYNIPLNGIKSIELETHFDEGYACCGGNDPTCYCSFAESASMDIIVWLHPSSTKKKKKLDVIGLIYGDISKIIQEIFEAEL